MSYIKLACQIASFELFVAIFMALELLVANLIRARREYARVDTKLPNRVIIESADQQTSDKLTERRGKVLPARTISASARA